MGSVLHTGTWHNNIKYFATYNTYTKADKTLDLKCDKKELDYISSQISLAKRGSFSSTG